MVVVGAAWAGAAGAGALLVTSAICCWAWAVPDVSSSGVADPPTGAGASSAKGWMASALSVSPTFTMRATDGTGPFSVFLFTIR